MWGRNGGLNNGHRNLDFRRRHCRLDLAGGLDFDSMKQRFVLVHAEAKSRCHAAVDAAEDGAVVKIGPPEKTRLQEEKYHAMVGDIARQWQFCGRKWDAEDMKRLCLDQFRRDTIRDPDFIDEWEKIGYVEMAPSLDGSGVVALGIQSRRLTKKLAIGFIEWLFALGAEHDVRWTEKARWAA